MSKLTVNSLCSELFAPTPDTRLNETIKLSRINNAVLHLVMSPGTRVSRIGDLLEFTYTCRLRRDGEISRLRLTFRDQFRSFNIGPRLAKLFFDRVAAAGFELTIVYEEAQQ